MVSLAVNGMRTLKEFRVELPQGLTVIIGANGSGKSTILEALEILRKSAVERDLASLLATQHSGSSLFRFDETQLQLKLGLEGFDYRLELGRHPAGNVFVTAEELQRTGVSVLSANAAEFKSFDEKGAFVGGGTSPHPQGTALASMWNAPLPVGKANQRFGTFRIHPPLSITASWASPDDKLRRDQLLQPPASFRFNPATNLAAAWHEIRNDRVLFEEALNWVERGLGRDVADVKVSVVANGRAVVALRFRGASEDIPLHALSDGEVAWLVHVATVMLARKTPPALLAIDEPELHLHPALQSRLTELYGLAGEVCPVVLMTHSDRIVDALPDAAASTILLTVNEERVTEISRPDPDALKRWLERYKFGDLRYDRREKDFFVAVPSAAESKLGSR
jgi:predicted ATPase